MIRIVCDGILNQSVKLQYQRFQGKLPPNPIYAFSNFTCIIFFETAIKCQATPPVVTTKLNGIELALRSELMGKASRASC